MQISRIGRAWMAMREDEIAAKAMGMNTRNIKLLAFAHGRHLRRRGGLRCSPAFQGFVSPESFTPDRVDHRSLAMVVLGGMGHMPGVILGARAAGRAARSAALCGGAAQQAMIGQVVLDAAMPAHAAVRRWR